jgi:transaldolase
MIDMDTIAGVAHDIAHQGLPCPMEAQKKFAEKPIWRRLRDLGTDLWLDTGDIEEAEGLWCTEFEALTTNNTLLNKEIQKGIYDDLVRDTANSLRRMVPDIDERRLVLEIAFVLNAHHGLKLVQTFDAHVSVEVHTDLGHDVERTVVYGKRFYDICPERFIIKVPLTPAGLLATRKLGRLGIPVNFTLGFSARQNVLAALFAKPKYVNVFMGRLNTFVVDNGLGDGQHIGEKATLATQRALRAERQQGRTPSLLIGASMRDASQVGALAGLDVFTMPPKVAAQYETSPVDHPADQTQVDPVVTLRKGMNVADSGLSSLWEVSEVFLQAVNGLLDKDPEKLSIKTLQRTFLEAGFDDLFPRWSKEDICMATEDGKIPVYDHWRERLYRGDMGLDALMNLSAFCSFATDQKALDNRICSLI